MPNVDLKFYMAVFMRRLPYFLIVAALVSAIGLTVASVLPPVYRSDAGILVEPQQIPGDLAQSTVPVNPFEQIQIIEQRIMTRTNLLALSERIGIHADQPDMAANDVVRDMRGRIKFAGFAPDETRDPDLPGATVIGVGFEAPTAELANTGANEVVTLLLQENVRLRTSRASDTLEFFETETARLSAEIEAQAGRIAEFKTANVEALPDSLDARRAQQAREQERLLALEREESALRNQRETVVWVFERTGRAASLGALSPEEEELQTLRSQLIQQRAVYAESSPRVVALETRVAALQRLVEEQRAQRATLDADGNPTEPASELDLELAPIDARLDFIAQEKATIQAALTELDRSIRATPANEMTLAGLERELENLQRQYQEAGASRSQAAVGERIEVLSKGERFSLIEPPTEPTIPVRPRRKLIALGGGMAGVVLGAGFVLLLELLNRSVRRPADLSAGLGIQPFATVPYIRTRRERRWKRGVTGAVLGLVVVVLPLGIFLLQSLYMPFDAMFGEVLEKTGLAALFGARS